MKVLVCGGAGYIGAHMVRSLVREGHQPIIFDNFSTGHRAAISDTSFIEGDLLDPSAIRGAFKSSGDIDAVIHLCALSLVGESVNDPYRYYVNNFSGTLNLLQAMRESGVGHIVFSSTAAVFGHPQAPLIDEAHPTQPINPYGASKLMVEQVLRDAAHAYGLRSVALRYFNAAGASVEGDLGESHTPETHLIPNVLRAALSGTSTLKVFGADYPTSDGTCVRDYVHVNDLASAHIKAIEYMKTESGAHVFNLGNGSGFSVKEVIQAAQRVTGRDISFEEVARRAGDPPVLVASSQRAREVLGWKPMFTDIEAIIETAWRWHQNPRY